MSESKIVIKDQRINLSLNEIQASIVLGNYGPQGPRGSQLLSGVNDPSPVIGLIGDFYVETSTGKLFGPKTSSGWGEGVPIGENDPNNLGQVHIELTPSTQWEISHTLRFVPNIVVVDSEGEVVEGFYEYLDESNIRATFSNPISGKAYLS
jgi:hypothetical protein